MSINSIIVTIETANFRFMKDQSIVKTFKTGLELKIAGDYQKKIAALMETTTADIEAAKAKITNAAALGLSPEALQKKEKALETLQKKEKALEEEAAAVAALLANCKAADAKKGRELYNKVAKTDGLMVDYLVKWFTGGYFVAERHEEIGNLSRRIATLRRVAKYAADPMALRNTEEYQKARELIKRDFTRLDNADKDGKSYFRRYTADLKAHEVDYITDLMGGVEPAKDSKTGVMFLRPYSNKKIARILFALQFMKLQGIKINAETADDLRKLDY